MWGGMSGTSCLSGDVEKIDWEGDGAPFWDDRNIPSFIPIVHIHLPNLEHFILQVQFLNKDERVYTHISTYLTWVQSKVKAHGREEQ